MEVPYTNPQGEQDTFYMHDKLYRGLQKIKERVQKRDFDQVFLIDGPEGSGKSVFGMQIGIVIDPNFHLDRVCMNPDEFVHAIQNSQKGQVVIYDEAYTGLAARQSLNKVNKLLVSMMMEMRQKNLIVIIILPTFFMLDKYVAVFRSVGLFHVYLNKGIRGYFLFYNTKKKKQLYILGKKMMTYAKPRTGFKGRFYGKYVLDEAGYRQKKDYALRNRDGKPDINETLNELKAKNDTLLYLLVKGLKERPKLKSIAKITTWLKDNGMEVRRQTLGKLWKDKENAAK